MGFGVHAGFRLDWQGSCGEVDGDSCSGVSGEQASDEKYADSVRIEWELCTLCGQTCSLRSVRYSRVSHPQWRVRSCVLAVLGDSMACDLRKVASRLSACVSLHGQLCSESFGGMLM